MFCVPSHLIVTGPGGDVSPAVRRDLGTNADPEQFEQGTIAFGPVEFDLRFRAEREIPLDRRAQRALKVNEHNVPIDDEKILIVRFAMHDSHVAIGHGIADASQRRSEQRPITIAKRAASIRI